MADKAWKAAERAAAEIVAGKRFWANSGEDIDIESDGVVAQCKNVRVCSLAELERLAIEAQRVGDQRDKVGLVLVKRRAGKGNETPWLVVQTAASYRQASGPLPGEARDATG